MQSNWWRFSAFQACARELVHIARAVNPVAAREMKLGACHDFPHPLRHGGWQTENDINYLYRLFHQENPFMTASKKSALAKKPAVASKSPVRAPAKSAAKPAPKPATAPAAKSVAKTIAAPAAAKPVNKPSEPAALKTVKAAKPEKPKKPKLVRDSFTIPKAEYLVLDELKQRAARLAHPVKKSELLRAGIKALAQLADAGFLAAVQAVPAIKTGRPKAAPQKPEV
jgi:hypothetical protein